MEDALSVRDGRYGSRGLGPAERRCDRPAGPGHCSGGPSHGTSAGPPATLGRGLAVHSFEHQRKCLKPPRRLCIRGLHRRRPKLARRKFRPCDRNRHPVFATEVTRNHSTKSKGNPRESRTGGVGSNMLMIIKKWCPGADLNHRHEDFQSTALPLSYPGTGAGVHPGSPQGESLVAEGRLAVQRVGRKKCDR